MIICKLKGGLGNQLFQYAVGRYVSNRVKTPLILDGLDYENDPLRTLQIKHLRTKGIYIDTNIEKNLLLLVKRLKKFNIFTEKETFTFDKNIYNVGRFTQIEGYWQNYNYFIGIKEDLKKELIPKKIDRRNNLMSEKIRATSNSVCLHIRRGDLISNPGVGKVHGVMDLEYYLNNLDYLNKKLTNLHVFVFSDDMAWAKENIKHKNIYFVDFNSGDEAYKDFALMRSCKHFVIPNSTLSWWAAWLEGDQGIVIAPKRWLKAKDIDLYENLIPKKWLLY